MLVQPWSPFRARHVLEGICWVMDSAKWSDSQGEHLFHRAQVYERFGVGQECASEASPLIVPASCRRAHIAAWSQSVSSWRVSFWALLNQKMFQLGSTYSVSGTTPALVESETIRTKCGHWVVGIPIFCPLDRILWSCAADFCHSLSCLSW